MKKGAKQGSKKRTVKEIEIDKAYAIKHYLMGETMRDIAAALNAQHPEYSISHVTVMNDIKEVIEEAKKIRKETGVSDLEELVLKYEYLYNEAIQNHFLMPNPAYITAASKQLEQISKLKGLQVEKQEISIKYDISIE
jgi:hypothetical protein